MKRTLNKVCLLLKKYGIQTETDGSIGSPDKILRDSWYVRKLMELGYLHCVHIDLIGENCFLAVLDEGRVMSGNNVMILDAFQSLEEIVNPDGEYRAVEVMNRLGFEIHDNGGYDTDSCIICPDYDTFEQFIKEVAV